MEEASKSKSSDDISVCMICREEEPDFLTFCSHNFHEDCLKQWHERIKNECPYCRSFMTVKETLANNLEGCPHGCSRVCPCSRFVTDIKGTCPRQSWASDLINLIV